MLILDAVLYASQISGFTAWPIAEPPDDGWLRLSGGMSPRGVGLAMAVLAEQSHATCEEDTTGLDGPALLRALIDAEALIATGGLRVLDTATGAVVVPGCCCGLEDWREWYGFADGSNETVPWLGHDPSPRLERAEGTGTLRLWQHGGHDPGPPASPPIEIPAAELPGLLAGVEHDVRAFRDLVRTWVQGVARTPDQADELVAALTAGFQIDKAADLV